MLRDGDAVHLLDAVRLLSRPFFEVDRAGEDGFVMVLSPEPDDAHLARWITLA